MAGQSLNVGKPYKAKLNKPAPVFLSIRLTQVPSVAKVRRSVRIVGVGISTKLFSRSIFMRLIKDFEALYEQPHKPCLIEKEDLRRMLKERLGTNIIIGGRKRRILWRDVGMGFVEVWIKGVGHSNKIEEDS